MELITSVEEKAVANLVENSLDEQLISLWLHGRSPCTIDYYRRSAHRFLLFVGKPLKEVKLLDVQEYDTHLVDRQLANSTRATILRALKSLFTFAQKLGYLQYNTGAPLRTPKAHDALNERILSEAEVIMMIHLETNIRNKVIMRLLYACGGRVSETLCSLKWKDLVDRDNQQGQITLFGKGSKTRTVLIPTSVYAEVLALRGQAGLNDLIFGLSRSQIHRIIKAAAIRANVRTFQNAKGKIDSKVSAHWFRHAHATHALERGAPISLVQATLGHSSIAMTGRYLHARPTESSAKYLAL
ncbi:MAG TPA: tyrosine-type recombinase/integrase [Candidatus Obscuribacterales bacterium]